MAKASISVRPVKLVEDVRIQIPVALHEAMKAVRLRRYQDEGSDVKISRIYVEAAERYLKNPGRGRVVLAEVPSSDTDQIHLYIPKALHDAMKAACLHRRQAEGTALRICHIYRKAVELFLKAPAQREILTKTPRRMAG